MRTIRWTRAPPATATQPASTFKTAARTSTSFARGAGQGIGGGEKSTGGGSLCDSHQAINFILSKSTPVHTLIFYLALGKNNFWKNFVDHQIKKLAIRHGLGIVVLFCFLFHLIQFGPLSQLNPIHYG